MTNLRGLRELGAKDVLERFAVPPRLMQRLGAWRARRVDITAAALEATIALPGLAEFLLAPAALPREGARLPEQFAMPDAPDLPELAVLDGGDGWQLIALSEEVVAAAGWGDPGEAAEPSGLQTVPVAAPRPPARLASAERALLFSPEQVAALQVAILAGTDDRERREALRSIALADLAPQEKGLLYLVALREGGDALRADAATQLGALGMRPELVKALRTYAAGDVEARRHALARLGVLAALSTDWEETVVTSVLISFLAEAVPELAGDVLGALASVAGRIAEDSALVSALLETLVPLLIARADRVARPAVRLLAELAARGDAAVSDALQEEAAALSASAAERRARSLIHASLARVHGTGEDAHALARLLLADVVTWDLLSAGHSLMEESLLALGESVLDAIGEGLAQGAAITRVELVGLAERLVQQSGSAEFANRAALVLATNLAGAPTMVASLIRQSPLLRRSDLSEATRAELATRLIEDAHLQPDLLLQAEVVDCFRSLGGAALGPLSSRLARVRRPEDTIVYLQALGESALGSPCADGELVRAALAQLAAIFESEGEVKAGADVALSTYGRLLRHPDLRMDELEAAFDKLRTSLWRTVLTASAIEALGYAVVAPASEISDRVATLELFLRLLTSRMPSAQGRERLEGGTIVYDLDDSETYTTRLPALLVALERAATSERVPAIARERASAALLERWQAVCEFQEIWGPSNAMRLAESLASLAASDLLPLALRRQLIAALRQRRHSLPVASLLSNLGGRLRGQTDLDEIFALVAVDLLDLERDPDFQTVEDREQILACAARILTRGGLVTAQGHSLREELLSTLYSGLRDRVPGVAGTLRRLQQDASLPEETRAEIARRLGRAPLVRP